MLKRAAIFDDRADRSIFAYGAVVICFASMLTGGLAVRSHREETMMQTMPSVPATVLTAKRVKNGISADIAFTRTAGGDPIDCKVQIGLSADRTDLHTGSVVQVVPRSDSCGEPAVVGPRNTTILASASGALFLISLILGALAAHSMLQSRHTDVPE